MSESQHWYSKEGRAAHTQPTKPGAKNPTRPTNTTDAKKQKLLPSVSGIVSMRAKRGLQRWIEAQLISACHRNAELAASMDLEAFDEKMREIAGEQVGAAAITGTEIHAIMEDVFRGIHCPDPERQITFPSGQVITVRRLVESVKNALDPLHLSVATMDGKPCIERILVNAAQGYAGMSDLICTLDEGARVGAVDYKTRKTKPGMPVFHSKEHLMQLAAYGVAFRGGTTPDFGINVYISTTEPGRVDIVEYDAADMVRGWECFNACLILWRDENEYDPRTSSCSSHEDQFTDSQQPINGAGKTKK